MKRVIKSIAQYYVIIFEDIIFLRGGLEWENKMGREWQIDQSPHEAEINSSLSALLFTKLFMSHMK